MGTQKAGSLEPTNAGEGKWWNKIGAVEIGQLSALARDIEKTVDQTVKHVARGKIKVGKLLLEARSLFQEDQAFGKWRKENTVIQSKQHAHYLMKIAERFGNATVLIEGANYSVMQELLLAEQKDIQWVTDKIDGGEPLPTVQEVRHKVKETQAERLNKGTSKKALKLGGKMKKIPMVIPNANMNSIAQMSLTHRIKLVVEQGIKGIEGDYLILGMDPDPQCPCHERNLKVIRDTWVMQAENKDEERAVKDSYNRIKEEFENWNIG